MNIPILLDERCARVARVQLPERERERLARRCRENFGFLDPGASAASDAGRAIAQSISSRLWKDAPTLARQLERARKGEIDAIYVEGLPTNNVSADLLTLALTYSLGLPFNYSTQNGGQVIMAIRPERNSAPNTNTTPDEFRWHTDDAAVPRDFRVSWIQLLGVANPPSTLTGYVPILPVLSRLSDRKFVLFEERFRVRVPLSFNLGDNIWTTPRAILSRSQTGTIEIAWPSYATDVVDAADKEALDALTELEAALDEFAIHVPVDPGCFFAFNNLRGVHMRTKIGNGDRLLYRTYARESLDELRRKTGSFGPIFDTRVVLAGQQI